MGKQAIEKRLEGYWKMEAANVVGIPAAIAFLAYVSEWQIGLLTLSALVPVCLLLAIGAHYWRSKLRQLRSGASLPEGLGLLSRLQWPSLGLTVLAVALTIASWLLDGLAASSPDRWIATLMATLAALEYVNYYHRQLQHFDHLPDLKRLFSGKGFRRSQMSVDLARWRARSDQR